MEPNDAEPAVTDASFATTVLEAARPVLVDFGANGVAHAWPSRR